MSHITANREKGGGKKNAKIPFLSPILDSSVLMLYSTPSYLISLLEVKLIKLPMYESAAELALEPVSEAISMKLEHKLTQ